MAVAVAVLALPATLSVQTGTGRQIRAVSDDREAAQLCGTNYRHIFGIASAIAFATVALAGIAYGISTEFSPDLGGANLLFAFEAVVIGGIGSLWGTLVGGMLLGIAQQLGAHFNPAYQVLVGNILFLVGAGGSAPGALRQDKRRCREQSDDIAPATTRSSRVKTQTRSSVAFTLGGAIVLIVSFTWAPWLLPASDVYDPHELLHPRDMATMWNLLAGYGGMVSIGQQAFIGLGAYAVLYFAIKGMNPFVAIPLAALVCAIIALPVTFLLFRLRGGYFSVATWVVADTAMLLILSFAFFGGGTGPLPARARTISRPHSSTTIFIWRRGSWRSWWS